MFYWIRKLYRPEYYQRKRSQGYFEGWYFKAAFEEEAFAFIPGVSLAEADPHAFIQVNRPGASSYHRFAASDFTSRRDRFLVALGENSFSLDGIRLRLPDLEADLRMGDLVRWPSRLLSPNSMGWFAFVPVMECYHGVIVLDGSVEGVVNGRRYSGGRFYLEKDWGASFPRGWIWMQANSFPVPGSLTCSIARVPFRGRSFTGFIIALYAGGRIHRFTTYNGARIEGIRVAGDAVDLTVRRGKQSLRVTARRTAGMKLASPVQGEMSGRIQESLDSEIRVRLEEAGRFVFDETGRHAGLEVINAHELEALGAGPGG